MKYKVWRELFNGGREITTGVVPLELEHDPQCFDSYEEVNAYCGKYFEDEGNPGGFVKIENTQKSVVYRIDRASWTQNSGNLPPSIDS